MSPRPLFWLAFLLLIVQAAVFYPRMPDPMATSFGGHGQAKDFMSPRGCLMFETLLVLVMTLVFVWMPPRLARNPARLNMPNKAYWLAPERAAFTFREVSRRMTWLGVIVLAFIGGLFQLTFQANLRPQQALDMTAFGWFMALWAAAFLHWLFSFYRRFRRV